MLIIKIRKSFLRVINSDTLIQFLNLQIKEVLKFLKIYNANERIKSDDTSYYELLRDIFDNSKIITKNIY